MSHRIAPFAPFPRPAVLAAVVAGLLVLLAAPVVRAGLTVCNESDEKVSVAVGYHSGSEWMSEGWWNPRPGKCATVIDGPLRNTHYYVHAYSSSYRWEDDYHFCVTPEKFTIYGDETCARRGYRSEGFVEIVVGDALDWTQRLTVSGSPSGSTASRIVGTWRGSEETLRFMSDGTLVIFDQEMQASGTYRVDGNRIKMELTGIFAVLGTLVGEVTVSGDRLHLEVPGFGSDTYTRVR